MLLFNLIPVFSQNKTTPRAIKYIVMLLRETGKNVSERHILILQYLFV